MLRFSLLPFVQLNSPKSLVGPEPDLAWVHRELRRKHVTRALLWQEYRDTPGRLAVLARLGEQRLVSTARRKDARRIRLPSGRLAAAQRGHCPGRASSTDDGRASQALTSIALWTMFELLRPFFTGWVRSTMG